MPKDVKGAEVEKTITAGMIQSAVKNEMKREAEERKAWFVENFEKLALLEYKQKTVKRKVASIKAFYSYLEDEEIIDDSPLRKIRTEFREEKILPRSIPYSILQSLLSSMYSKKSIESTISEKNCYITLGRRG